MKLIHITLKYSTVLKYATAFSLPVRLFTSILICALSLYFSVRAWSSIPEDPLSFVEFMDEGKTEQVGAIHFRECRIGDFSSTQTKTAECTEFYVPENYDEPEGKKIPLFIVRFPSLRANRLDNAVVFMEGGPGGSATETFINIDQLQHKILRDRDIYLIDQRGTGKSQKLTCTLPDAEDMPLIFDAELARKTTRTCLSDIAADPRFYTTSVAVRDLDAVREALGFSQWNLYGVSYGTRVALHYLRQFESKTRSVILDATVHPEINLGPAIAFESQRAVKHMVARCEADTACQKAFPALGEGIKALFGKLNKKPIKLVVEDFVSGKHMPITFTKHDLAGVIRMSLYSAGRVATLPVALYEAYAYHNFSPLARQSRILKKRLSSTLSWGMHNAVVCTEDVPFVQEELLDREALAQTYMGTDMWDSLKVICETWPKGIIDSNFKAPVVSAVPALLLSGSADPITPPAYAIKVERSLKHSRHIIVPDQGHGQLMSGCMPTIMAQFIENTSVADLNSDCINTLAADPFFVNFNGPTP